jgi:2-dehydropantoate 2-reductase
MARIGILGAGAIGSVLGAFLSRAGHDVTLIGRSSHVAAIRRDGLRIDGSLGAFTLPVATAEALGFHPDIVFLTVKTQDVLSAIEANRAWLTQAPLVTFQNGVRSDEMVATALPPGQIVSAVVNIHATYLTPGIVTLLYPGPVVIGRPFGPNDTQVAEIAALLRQVVPTTVSNNIAGVHWLKLIGNVNNALPALTNATFEQVYADRYLRRVAILAMREGVRVAKRAGIRLESLPDISTILIELLGWLPLPLAAALAATKIRRMESAPSLLGSTLQSLRRNQPTEIDYLNGEIVRRGQAVGVPTPVNTAIVEMVHHVEQTGKFWTVNDIRATIGAKKDRQAVR